MKNTFHYLIISFFCGAIIPATLQAAAYSPLEEMQTLARSVLARIDVNPEKDPTRERMREYISQAQHVTEEQKLPALIDYLKKVESRFVKQDIFGINDDISPRGLLAVKFSLSRKKALEAMTESGPTDHKSSYSGNLALCEKIFMGIPPEQAQARLFLRTILENIEKQNRFMLMLKPIVTHYASQLESFKTFELRKEEHIENVAWFSRPTHTDPIIIALQLRHMSEWKKINKEAHHIRISPAFLQEMWNSGIKQLQEIAEYEEKMVANNICSEKIRCEYLQLNKKINNKHADICFDLIPGLKLEEQPIYFAKKGLTCIFCLNSYYNQIPKVFESGDDEALDQTTRKLLHMECDLIELVKEFEAHAKPLSELHATITTKLKELPEPSFIDPKILLRNQINPAARRSSGKKSTRKQMHRTSHVQPQESVAASFVVPHSTSTRAEQIIDTEPITAAASTSKTHIQPIKKGPITETTSLIRIDDPTQNITLALFRIENPTAPSIKSCAQTAAMQLWITNPDMALERLGYLDESHKNYTSLTKKRTRMKQYHGFTTSADHYVTQCGIKLRYLKKDGAIHTMICMPGAIYFADGSYQIGIFTYLIDPANNQLYHRMFHECSGEKIITEYQARGYWDLDPELQ